MKAIILAATLAVSSLAFAAGSDQTPASVKIPEATKPVPKIQSDASVEVNDLLCASGIVAACG